MVYAILYYDSENRIGRLKVYGNIFQNTSISKFHKEKRNKALTHAIVTERWSSCNGKYKTSNDL